VLVNSLVLQLAGVTRDSVPPTGGVIERDADGEPTGVLRETAQELIAHVVPPYTPEEVTAGVDKAIGLLHAVGITSITDPGIGLDQLALYAGKARDGALPLRVTALLSGGTTVPGLSRILDDYEPVTGVDPMNLRVAGVKLFGDGVPTAAQTALLHEPYVDGTNGSMVFEGSTEAEQVATLNAMVRLVNDRGMQVGTHATGDATIDHVVAAYIASQGRRGRRRDLRNYVIHGDLTPPGTLRTMAAHGIGVNMNATIKYLLGRTLDPNLGPERVDYQWPYRTALDAGVVVTSASDAPVTPPHWLQGVMAAMRREGRFGGVAGEAERITVPEALASYTRAPAWQDHAERAKGMLTPGMAADVTIVGGDVLGSDPHDLMDMPITHTVVGGDVVFEAGSDAPSARRAQAAVAALGSRGHRAEAVANLQAGGCCCAMNERLHGHK
jgi:predicted amidohydrolase YtcJ